MRGRGSLVCVIILDSDMPLSAASFKSEASGCLLTAPIQSFVIEVGYGSRLVTALNLK